MKTVIVIPTYNEKGNIGKLIEVLQKVFKKVPKGFDWNPVLLAEQLTNLQFKDVKDESEHVS